MPSPCGPHSSCKSVNGVAFCACLSNFVGVPPNCHYECSVHQDCPSTMSCQQNKCKAVCPDACGSKAACVVINHQAVCNSRSGLIPFVQNSKISCKEFKFFTNVTVSKTKANCLSHIYIKENDKVGCAWMLVESSTMIEAKQSCERMEASLPDLRSLEENNHFYQLMMVRHCCKFYYISSDV